MAKNKSEEPKPVGFEDMSTSLIGVNEFGGGLKELDHYEDIPSYIQDKLNNTPAEDTNEDPEIVDDPKFPIQDPPSEELEELDTEENQDSNEDPEGIQVSDLGEYEPEVLGFFIDKFQEQIGWEFDADEKPKSVEELIKYMETMVNENVTKAFANEEILELNEFVKNGGSIDQYVNRVYASDINLDSLDLTKSSVQRMLISEDLRNRGFNETKINKLLTKYEETESMEEEAEDAFNALKAKQEEDRKKLLDAQAESAKQVREQEQKFVLSVEENIKKTKDILGVDISDKERKETLEYIFKKGPDGMTNFQKDYTKDVNNLITTAFIMRNRDKFQTKVKTQAATQATKSLRETLASRNKVSKNEPTTRTSPFSVLSAQLSKPRI